MGTISVSLPSDGTSIDAADVNTPFNTIVNELNGNIDNANIKSAAAISGSKLADASLDIGLKGSVWDGWIAVADSWTYASATTITVPTDATTKYSVGDKIKLVQSGSTKYFYITSVAATTLTVNGGSDYTVANAAISGVYYSKAATPLGFPQAFSWTPTWTNLTTGNGTLNYAKYIQTGKTVHFRLKFTLGSTSTVGTTPTFTAPVTLHADYSSVTDTINGDGQYNDATGVRWKPWLTWASSTTIGLWRVDNAPNLQTVTASAPFVWTTSDQIMITGSYEAA